MAYFLLVILIQIACVVHCIRNRGNSLWLMAIIFLPLAGSLAYAIFEILPDYAGRREVRSARAAALRKLDPEREIRAARNSLELADTAANRTSLGDALASAERWSEAADQYREARARSPSGDRPTWFKLAVAELEAGRPGEARTLLESLPPSGSASENDRAALYLARALEAAGEKARALALYRELGERIAGCEALCRQAALLVGEGRKSEARAPLEEVARRVKRLDRHQRAEDGDMYAWAERTLAEIQVGG